MYLSGFTEAIREATGSNISRFDSWSDAISFFVESSPGKKIIAIDEFQYLMMSDKGILRKFQSLWDNYLSKKDVMLILCGSHLSMMRNITSDYNSPLFQRNTAEIRIMPLPFEVTADGKDRDHGGSRSKKYQKNFIRKQKKIVFPNNLLLKSSS